MEGLEQLAAAAEALRSPSPTRRMRVPRERNEPPSSDALRRREPRTITISNYANQGKFPAPELPKSAGARNKAKPPIFANRPRAVQPAAPTTVFIELPVASFSGIPTELFVTPELPEESEELPAAAAAAAVPQPLDAAVAPKKKKKRGRTKKEQSENADPKASTPHSHGVKTGSSSHSAKVMAGRLRQWVAKAKIPGLLTRAQRCRAGVICYLADNPGCLELEIRNSVGQIPDVSKALRKLCEDSLVERIGDGTKNKPYTYKLQPAAEKLVDREMKALQIDSEANKQVKAQMEKMKTDMVEDTVEQNQNQQGAAEKVVGGQSGAAGPSKQQQGPAPIAGHKRAAEAPEKKAASPSGAKKARTSPRNDDSTKEDREEMKFKDRSGGGTSGKSSNTAASRRGRRRETVEKNIEEPAPKRQRPAPTPRPVPPPATTNPSGRARESPERTKAKLPSKYPSTRPDAPKNRAIEDARRRAGRLRAWMTSNRALLPDGLLSRHDRAEAQVLLHIATTEGPTSRDLREACGDTPDISKALMSVLAEGLVKRDGLGSRSVPFTYWPNGPQLMKMLPEVRAKLAEDAAAHAQLKDIVPKDVQF